MLHKFFFFVLFLVLLLIKVLWTIFQDLCSWIAPSLPKERKISVERKVLATLWYLGSTETFRIIGDRFNMSKGSMHRVLHTVCSALVGQQQQCIKWPDVTQMECSAQEFQEK